MLVLTRKPKEAIIIGDSITLTVEEIKGGKVRLGIDAPKEISVVRPDAKEKGPKDRRGQAISKSPPPTDQPADAPPTAMSPKSTTPPHQPTAQQPAAPLPAPEAPRAPEKPSRPKRIERHLPPSRTKKGGGGPDKKKKKGDE